MSKKCKIVYFDQNGKESKVYLDNLDKGEDIAKKLYLESMAGLVTTKFQKGDPNSEYSKVPKRDTELFTKLQKMFKAVGEDPHGVSATKFIRRLNNQLQQVTMRDFAMVSLLNERKHKILKAMPHTKGTDMLIDEDSQRAYDIERADAAEIQAEEYYSEIINPSLIGEALETRKTNIKNMLQVKNKALDILEDQYEVQRQYGSEVHGLMELYINLRTEYLEKTKNYSNKLDGYVRRELFTYVYREFYKNLNWKKKKNKNGEIIIDENGKYTYEDNISEINKKIKLNPLFLKDDTVSREKLAKQIKKIQPKGGLKVSQTALGAQLTHLEQYLQDQGEGASFITELQIGDTDFHMRGIADLLVLRKDGTILPVDYKTKTARGSEVSKMTEFSNTNYGYVGGSSAFKGLFKNRKTDVNIQLTIIKEILEKNGFKGRVLSPEAILITGKFEEVMSPSTKGSYTDFKFEIVPLGPVMREFRNYIKESTNFKIEEQKIAGYENSITAIRNLVGVSTGEFNSPESIEDRIAFTVSNLRTNDEGELYFKPAGDIVILPLESSGSFIDRKNFVKKYFEDHESMNNAEKTAQSVIDYFNEKRSGVTEFTSVKDDDMANRYNTFLSSISPLFYDLKLLKNYEGYADAQYSNVLVAEHKRNKTIQLIEVSGIGNKPIDFQNGSSRNSIFGQYLKDGSIKGIAEFDGLPNETYSGGLMRLTLVAAQFATDINFNGVERLTVGSPTLSRGSDNIESVVPQDMVLNLKIFQKIVEQNPDDFTSNSIKQLLDNPEIYKTETYQADPLASWYSFLVDYEIKQANRYANKDAIIALKEHYVENVRDSKLITQETRDLLYKAILRLKKSLVTQKEFENDPHVRELVKSYLHLERIPIDIVESVHPSNFLVGTMQSTQNETIKALNKLINNAKLQTLNEGIGFLGEHARLVKELKKDKGVITNRFVFEQAGVLEAMLVDGYKSKEGDWLKFKPDNELDTIQKKYKKFFIKTMREVFFGKGKKANELWENATQEGGNWDPDWIPAIAASKTNAIQESLRSGQLKKSAGLMFDSFGRKAKAKKTVEGDSIYNLQADSTAIERFHGNWEDNRKRKTLLGQMDWRKGDTPKDVETNLETVLNYLVMTKINRERNEKVIVAASAIHAAIKMEEEFGHKSTDPLLKFINDIIKLNVIKTVDEAGKVEGFIEKVGKSASSSALFLSAGLFSVELVTSFFGTINSGIDNILRGFVGRTFADTGLKPRYSNSELWKRSIKLMTFQEGELSVALDRLYGISTMDPKFVTQKMSETKNKSILNTQKMFEYMSFASRGLRRQMFMAKIEVDRTIDAFEYVRDTDSVIYFPEKDKRLFIEHVEGRAPRTDLEKKKAAFYKLLLSELKRDGFVEYDDKGNERITRPYTSVQISKVKEHADVIYGSLDGEEKIISEKYALMRAFLVLKKFILPKIKMYWRGDTSKYGGRDTTGEFIYNKETGEYMLNTTPEEGIIQTWINLFKLLNNMYVFNRDSTIKNKDTMKVFWNANRAGNMTKFASDLTLIMIGFLVTAGLSGDDEDDDEGFIASTVYGKALLNGVKNATMDYNFALSILNIAQGDGLIGFSILARATTNIFEAFWNSEKSELHYDREAILRGLDGMNGMFRTTHGGIEIITK